MKIKDQPEIQTGAGTKRINPFDNGLPAMSQSEIYQFSVFRTLGCLEQAILSMDIYSYKPYLMVKLAICSISDRGERTRLLDDLSKIYKQVLDESRIKENALAYPEKAGNSYQFFWFQLTSAILPLVGEIHQWLDTSLNLSQENVVLEA